MKKYTSSLFLLLIVITFFFTSCEKYEFENSIESCTSDLVFDRLIIFDSKSIHAASAYFGQNLNDSRLTHLFFFD